MSGIVRISLGSLLAMAAPMTLSCGGSSSRVLQSISVSPQSGAGQVQFVATGHFSAPPETVTPLMVNWGFPGPAPTTPCSGSGCPYPSITSQGIATCGTNTGNTTVIASAPRAQKMGAPLVTGTATLSCP